MRAPVYSARSAFADARAGVHEKMWRIRAGGQAIFAWEAEIAGLERLETLRPGTELFMGVVPLVDGTFRLRWLHTQVGESFAARALAGREKAAFEAAGRGEVSGFTRLENVTPPSDPDAGAEGKLIADLERAPASANPADLYRAEGEAARVKAEASIRLMPKARMDPYLSYSFTCAGRQLHFTFSNEKSAASPVHPFFLAEGDKIRVVVGRDERTVQALLNLEDGCRYLRTFGAYASRRWVTQQVKNAFGVSGSIIAAALLAFAANALSANLFLAAAGIAVFLGVVLGLGAWLENLWGMKFGQGRADLLRILDALDVTAKEDGAVPYVHMLEARYPVSKIEG